MELYDKYKFYTLTDDDYKMWEDYGFDGCYPVYMFIYGDYPFKDVLKDINIKHVISFHNLPFINELRKYKNFRTYKIGSSITPLWVSQYIISNSDRLILYCKIPYFHTFIFHVREACKDEVPEDVVKYILELIKIELFKE
jgi:hypothetical protein